MTSPSSKTDRLTPAQLDAALRLAPPCLWCGESTDRASFAVGDRVFCSGKCARYFETAPVSSAATFFEDARRHFEPWTAPPLQLAGLAEVARLRAGVR